MLFLPMPSNHGVWSRFNFQLRLAHFLMKHSAKLGKGIEKISQTAMDALVAYPWPGNVRELENVIERAVIISQGAQLELGEWLPKPIAGSHSSGFMTLEQHERQHILEALERTRWQVSGKRGAATMLGIKPTTLHARMKKLGIRKTP